MARDCKGKGAVKPQLQNKKYKRFFQGSLIYGASFFYGKITEIQYKTTKKRPKNSTMIFIFYYFHKNTIYTFPHRQKPEKLQKRHQNKLIASTSVIKKNKKKRKKPSNEGRPFFTRRGAGSIFISILLNQGKSKSG